MSLLTQFLVAFGAPRRDEAARKLAARLGCDSVVIFAPGSDAGTLIPITPFEANASATREWRQAIAAASGHDTAEPVKLRHPNTDSPVDVWLRRAEDGSILAAIGRQPRPARLEWARRVLPLLSSSAREKRLREQLAEARREAAGARHAAGEAERRAAEASRLKDDFLATLSHELRTPLNAMIGWIQMLRLYRHDEAIWARAIEVIDRNARAQAQIVGDLLDVSRIITGKLRLRLSPVDLRDVVQAGCDSVRPTVDAKNLQLVIDTADVPGVVMGDPDRLQQVVWNLVSNAAKFTPPGGRIEVSVGADDGSAWIRVRDTGIGIQPDFVPHVFERFRQWDSGVTRAHGGLGLGLAIVRHLVELHGGGVDAASEGENRGATFTVRLPCRPATATTTAPAERSAESPREKLEARP